MGPKKNIKISTSVQVLEKKKPQVQNHDGSFTIPMNMTKRPFSTVLKYVSKICLSAFLFIFSDLSVEIKKQNLQKSLIRTVYKLF